MWLVVIGWQLYLLGPIGQTKPDTDDGAYHETAPDLGVDVTADYMSTSSPLCTPLLNALTNAKATVGAITKVAEARCSA